MSVSDAQEWERLASQQNFYVCHLAEVNTANTIICTEDIYNTKGALVIKRGSAITADVAQRILRHKLLRPIEQDIQFSTCLDAESLYRAFTELLERYPDAKRIHEAQLFDKLLIGLIEHTTLNPVFLQKMTVMQERLPKEFEKSLFSAWLCGLISMRMGRPLPATRNAFIAGLCRDIGLLHIDPDILFKRDDLTPDDWRAIKCHVVVGGMIMRNLAGVTAQVSRAVFEHHECCDGTGYPHGLSEDALSVTGQILGMADSIQAIRINRFEGNGRNMRDLLPYLHMNSNKHFVEVYKATCKIIMECDLPTTLGHGYPDIGAFAQRMLENIDTLENAVVVLGLVRDLAEEEPDSPCCKRFYLVVNPVLTLIASSGLVRTELVLWLKRLSLQPDEGCVRDLIEMELMHGELFWQLNSVVRVLKEYVGESRILNEFQKQHMMKLSDYIQKEVAPAA